MRVGIIGTNWGRVHCGTFRAAGCDVAVLVGPREAEVVAVAAAEGVPVASTEPDALEACDIVVIASPTPTHPRTSGTWSPRSPASTPAR